jgi:hypothetical protein
VSDWTREAATAIELCEQWATQVSIGLQGKLYLFGSAIYKGGEQFDATFSDLDLVYLFPEETGALDRCEHMKTLLGYKKRLELDLIPALHRLTCDDPGVSLIPVTSLELQANVHKSGARSFFDRNFFYDLGAKTVSLSIPTAGTSLIRDDHRQALEYVQKLRNEYLSISANGIGGLNEFSGSDPIPKALLRSAAQLVPDVPEGEWYDTRLGLEFMHKILIDRRTEHDAFKMLFDKISVRRGGRGRGENLTAFDQLLLAEMLFDKASEAQTEPLITWVLHVTGNATSKEEVAALLAALARIAPDARVIGVACGSIVLTVRSSKRTFDLLQRLQTLGALPHLLDVSSAEMQELAAGHAYLQIEAQESRLSKLLTSISKWTPPAVGTWKADEEAFSTYLQKVINESPELSGAFVHRDATFEPVEVPFEMDFLLSWPDSIGIPERIGIELARIRSTATFFQKVAQLLQLGRPVIFVLVGKVDLLDKLRGDTDRLATLNANIKIVRIFVTD